MGFAPPRLVHAVCETRTNSFVQIHNKWIASYYAFHLTHNNYSSPCQYTYEFICVQAPCTTQGAVHWSAAVVCHLQHQSPCSRCARQPNHWYLICERVKRFLILVSLVLFSCVSRHYTYLLPTARWDHVHCTKVHMIDWRHQWEVHG